MSRQQEKNIFRSADGSAGIADMIQRKSKRGGLVLLPCGRYELQDTVHIDTPCLRLEGECWSYSRDPNGVFESLSGTKLRLMKDIPAVSVGSLRMAEGCVIRNLGMQGNIKGMDTRPLFDGAVPGLSRGLSFNSNRIDQGEFSKLSFCGLSCAVFVDKGSELDACTFEKNNFDGCAVGVWFAPRASYYTLFRQCVFADHPYYGIYVDGAQARIHNLEVVGNKFVRNGGAFREDWECPPASVYLNCVNNSLIRDNLFDAIGTFWYYNDDAVQNDQRQPLHRKTESLVIRGNGNRIIGNVFEHSSGMAIHVIGNDNVLLNCISDANIVLEGENNQAIGNVFTKADARLIISSPL